MTGGKRKDVDLTGIRQRGLTFQVRVFGGTDPVTGKQIMLTGSADSQTAAIDLRDGFRKQVRERTSVRTNVTLGFLLDEWLAGHQVEDTTRAAYVTYIEKFLRPALGGETSGGSRSSAHGPTNSSTRSCGTADDAVGARHSSSTARPRMHECDARCAARVQAAVGVVDLPVPCRAE